MLNSYGRFLWLGIVASSLLCGCSTGPKTATDEMDTTDQASEVAIPVDGTLRVTVIDDEGLAKVLQREWRATSEYDVEVINQTTATLRGRGGKLDTDAVIGPSSVLGELAANNRLRTLPIELTRTDGESAYRMDQVYSAVARKELRWEGRQFGVSFGSPVLLLMTRNDIVPNPPETWSGYFEIIDRLAKEDSPAEGITPISQPLGGGWAAKTFLARSAAYLYHPSRVSSFFDYTDLTPRIASAPFVRTLSEMKKDFREEDTSLSPNQVFAKFLAGKTAMAICWPMRQPSGDSDPPNFGVTIRELPGSQEEYDWRDEKWIPLADDQPVRHVTVVGAAGLIGGISRSAKNAKLAGVFLGWATSPDQSPRLSPRAKNSAPFRKTHRTAVSQWCDQHLGAEGTNSYLTALEGSLKRSEVYVSLRIPGQDRYMAVLDEQVLLALRGKVSVTKALQTVHDQWNEITDTVGREKQIKAYRHSIGISID